jgi:hypothetical protein
MSEPSSLYARVSLSADAFAAYRASPVARASDYDDWLAWLADKSYSGPRMTAADIAAIADSVSCTTAGEWIDGVAGFGARSAYDKQAGRWILMAAQFSENYREYIEALAVLRAAGRFKDRGGDDFVLIYPFYWGYPGGVGARIAQGSSTLWGPLPQAAVTEASAALQAFHDEMTRGLDLDKL